MIQVAAASEAKVKRAPSYVYYNDNDIAETTSDLARAARFTTSRGQLFSRGATLGLSNADIAAGFAKFRLFFTTPDISHTFNVRNDGTFRFDPTNDSGESLHLTVTYCKRVDTGEIYTRYTDSDVGFSCTTLSISTAIGMCSPNPWIAFP